MQGVLMFLMLCLSYIEQASASLSTDGPFIVNTTTGVRVYLKCVNWYGAHQELYSVGGLERQSIRNISRQIVLMGANCVRLPLSIDIVRDNPPVLPSTIAAVDPAECPGLHSIHGMELLDCVVQRLTADGIMVILNNHVSRAGWVGTNTTDEQGLWNMPGYPTAVWIESLVNVTARYRSNPLVVGIDILPLIQGHGMVGSRNQPFHGRPAVCGPASASSGPASESALPRPDSSGHRPGTAPKPGTLARVRPGPASKPRPELPHQNSAPKLRPNPRLETPPRNSAPKLRPETPPRSPEALEARGV